MTELIDTNVKCPRCGAIHDPDFASEGDIECDCGTAFSFHENVRVTYTMKVTKLLTP